MKKNLFISLITLMLVACNMQVQAVPSNLPPTVATETSVYTQPLPTVGNFLTQMAPTIEATLTPFLPATSTSIPVGSLNVIARWEDNRAIVQTEFQWTNKNRTSNVTYRLLCDGNIAASGPIVEGMNPAACEPNVDFEYKIGDVTVTWGRKEGYTVGPIYTINIP